MALSYQEAILPAGTTSVVISIPFLQPEDLVIELNDVPTSAYQITNTTPKTVVFDSPIAADNTKFMLLRETNADDLFQKFSKGSQFTPANLDILHYQLLWLAQEVKERGRNISFDNLNMNGYRIINLGKHVDPTDAMQWQEFIDHLASMRYVPDIPEDTPREKTFARGKKGWIEIAGDGGIPDAPDTQYYVRTKGAWVLTADPANATPDVPVDQVGTFLRERVDEAEAKWVKYVPPEPPTPPAIMDDAPADGKTYGRKDNAWSVAGGGGGDSPLPEGTAVFDSCVKTKLSTGEEVWVDLKALPEEYNKLNTYAITSGKSVGPVGVMLAEGLGADTRKPHPIQPSGMWMDRAIKFSTFEHPETTDSNPTRITFNSRGLKHTTALDRKYLLDLIVIKGPDGLVRAGTICQVLFGNDGVNLTVGREGAQTWMTMDGINKVNIKESSVRFIIDYETKTVSAYQLDQNCNIVADTTLTTTLTGVMDRADTRIRLFPYFKYHMWGGVHEEGTHFCLRRFVFGNYFIGVRPYDMSANTRTSTARAGEVFTNIPSANMNWSLWSPINRVRGASGYDSIAECTDPTVNASTLIDSNVKIDGDMGSVSSGVNLTMNPYISMTEDYVSNVEDWEAKKRIHHLRRGRDWVELDIPPEGFAPNNTQELPCMRSKNVYEPLATLDRTYSFEKINQAVTHFNPLQDYSDYLHVALKLGCTTTVYYNIPDKVYTNTLDMQIYMSSVDMGDQYVIFKDMKVERLSNIQPTTTDGYVYTAKSVFAVRVILNAVDDWELQVLHPASETDQTMVVGTVFHSVPEVVIQANSLFLKNTRNSVDFTNTGMMCIVDSQRGMEYTLSGGLVAESTEPLCTGRVCGNEDVRTNKWPTRASTTYYLDVLSKSYTNWVAGAPVTTPSVREYGNSTDVNSAPLLWSPQAGCFVPLNGLKATTATWSVLSKDGRAWNANAANPLVISGWDWVSRTALLVDGTALTDDVTNNVIEFYESMHLTTPRMKVTMQNKSGVVTVGVIHAEVVQTTGILTIDGGSSAPFAITFRPINDTVYGTLTEVAVTDRLGAQLGTVVVRQMFTTGTVAVLAPTAGNVRLFSLNGRQRRVQPNDDAGKPLISGGAVEHYRGVPVMFPNGVSGNCPISDVRGFKTATKYVTGYTLA